MIRDTQRTPELGIARWRGEIVGKSYEDDAPGDTLGFAIAMDEPNGLV
jgi:hypothetical protein